MTFGELQQEIKKNSFPENKRSELSNRMLLRFMETSGKDCEILDEETKSELDNYHYYTLNFEYLKLADLEKFLDLYDKQGGLFFDADYHGQELYNFRSLLQKFDSDESFYKNRFIDLSKSGQGISQNAVGSIMLIEFSDWVDCIKKYDVYKNNRELFKKCENIHELLKNSQTFKIMHDKWSKIERYINEGELKSYLQLYVLFTGYLYKLQTMLLQRYVYNTNSSPTFLIPFSSELNALVSFDANFETKHEAEANLQSVRLLPHAVYITDKLKVYPDNDGVISIADEESVIVCPVILTDGYNGLDKNKIKYKRLGNYLIDKEQNGSMKMESYRGKIYNYIYMHRPTYDELAQITFPFAWKYLYKDTPKYYSKSKNKKDVANYHNEAPIRDSILRYVFQQYAFVGFNSLAEEAGFSKDAFLLNNPFIDYDFKFVSILRDENGKGLNKSYCKDITKTEVKY